MVGQRGKGALQVVQAHQAMAQVDVGLLVFVFPGGLDGEVEPLPLLAQLFFVGAELRVQHPSTAGRRHNLHAVNNMLES